MIVRDLNSNEDSSTEKKTVKKTIGTNSNFLKAIESTINTAKIDRSHHAGNSRKYVVNKSQKRITLKPRDIMTSHHDTVTVVFINGESYACSTKNGDTQW